MTYETFSTIHEVIKTKGIHLSAILDQENKAPKIHRKHYLTYRAVPKPHCVQGRQLTLLCWPETLALFMKKHTKGH